MAKIRNDSGDRRDSVRLLHAHSPLCRLLDRPARRRSLSFVCICGADSPKERS
jgi:hypothetical protein